MKIYVLPLSLEFQPPARKTVYPKHNKKDYGIEQDFIEYLKRNPWIVTTDPDAADWHYLPVYWTRYHVGHNYGKSGRESLQHEVTKQIIDEERTFTICQYADGPLVDLGETTSFLASRRTDEGTDIPLLCSPHRAPLFYRTPFFKPPKKYLASFVGRFSTHPIRQEMARSLQDRSDIYVCDGIKKSRFLIKRALDKYIPLWKKRESRFFVRKMLESYIALCPRGYGGASFRFYEAMQLGVVPFLIGDIDTRPFKAFLDWDQMSLYARSVEEARDSLDSYAAEELLRLGKLARAVWYRDLAFGKWCRYVLKELETIS